MKKRVFVFIFFSMIITESTVFCSQHLTDVVKLIRHLSYGSTEEPFTERNIYLDKVVIWNPGVMGSSWWGNSSLCDDQGIPINNGLALGPPTGTGAGSRGGNCTAVGINGEAAFRFEKGYYIFDGPGDDFITFEGSFSWGFKVDGLCCELAHVEVSEDAQHWYYNTAEQYDLNPKPSENNPNYVHESVKNMHGNNPTWANHTMDMQAFEIQSVNGVKKWVKVPNVYVSKDFKPTDPYLGGDRFDLSTFQSIIDNTPWPKHGKMRYVKIIDDDRVIDGQDYNKPWCLGAQMQSAMGIHVKKE